MFKCDMCGLCCKNISGIIELKENDDGTGRCIYLNQNNLCRIFDNRPEVCNTEKMYNNIYRYFMSKAEYDTLNILGCVRLKTQEGGS